MLVPKLDSFPKKAKNDNEVLPANRWTRKNLAHQYKGRKQSSNASMNLRLSMAIGPMIFHSRMVFGPGGTFSSPIQDLNALSRLQMICPANRFLIAGCLTWAVWKEPLLLNSHTMVLLPLG